MKGEKLCCVVIGNVSIIFWFKKGDEVWISFCFKFLVLLRVSCILLNCDFKLLLVVLSFKFAIYFRC